MNQRLTSLGYRIYGKPPGPGAPREALLLWIRRFYLTGVPAYVVLGVLAAITASLWLWVGFGLMGVVWLAGMTKLSLQIRRERRSHGA